MLFAPFVVHFFLRLFGFLFGCFTFLFLFFGFLLLFLFLFLFTLIHPIFNFFRIYLVRIILFIFLIILVKWIYRTFLWLSFVAFAFLRLRLLRLPFSQIFGKQFFKNRFQSFLQDKISLPGFGVAAVFRFYKFFNNFFWRIFFALKFYFLLHYGRHFVG